MRSTTLLQIRDHATAAFSLIEIVLAIAIISFALVGILGLFPVAIQTATNSQRETQAALIARSIFTDLESQSGKDRFLLLGKDTTPDADAANGQPSSRFGSASRIPIDLTNPESKYLGYNVDGTPISAKMTAGDYKRGTSKAAYIVQISVVDPATLPAPTPMPGIAQLQVTVGAPGGAAIKKRISYPFVSLLDTGITTP